MAGMRKASVFPLPVLAAPTRSRPSSRCGMAFDWISVMLTKPMASIALSVAGDTFPARDAKEQLDRMPPRPVLVPGTAEKYK